MLSSLNFRFDLINLPKTSTSLFFVDKYFKIISSSCLLFHRRFCKTGGKKVECPFFLSKAKFFRIRNFTSVFTVELLCHQAMCWKMLKCSYYLIMTDFLSSLEVLQDSHTRNSTAYRIRLTIQILQLSSYSLIINVQLRSSLKYN